MGAGLQVSDTTSASMPSAQPSLSSNPAPPAPPQVQSPMNQSGKSGGMDLSSFLNPQQGQQPKMGQPNQYSQTIGDGNDVQPPAPNGGKTGKSG